MSATEAPPTTVTLTVDGRSITVPKGTPLVIAAAQAGVEVPVFCYEPRLGAPIGACRMCLVEIEGMPKLQAGCTMVATDGMVVRTAHASEKAKDGQDAVLEFILLNHPLDCPVCDKGGECPLQDLTFRYGPGTTRMTLPKRTYEKPLPISPSIVLDRERCILCYRCTRFSEDVAEDGELIARERGGDTVIATFQERPYTGLFSGNVTELCPVGALLPTPYRFKARPWEIVNVPTVCGHCPTGCNVWATLREGKVERVLSRNHPEVDDGWLCDRGRFARHEPLAERLREPLLRGQTGLEPRPWNEAARLVAQRLRHVSSLYGPGSVAIMVGGSTTNEEAFAWSRIAEELGARTASGPVAAHSAWERLAPYRARIADLDTADVVVVVGDAEVADRAGVVELRVRQARRRGAHLGVVGPGGASLERDCSTFVQTRPEATASSLHALASRSGDLADLGGALAAAECPVVVVTDPIDLAHVEALAAALQLDRKAGGVLCLPGWANEIGARQAGIGGGGDEILEAAESGKVRALVFADVDPVSDWPEADRWQMALASAEVVVASAPFTNATTTWAHLVLPAAVDHEREGSLTNLEGRTQRMRPAAQPPGGVGSFEWLSAVAGELGIDIGPTAPKAFARMVAARPAFGNITWSSLGERAPLAAAPAAASPAPSVAPPAEPAMLPPAEGGFALIAPPTIMRGPAVERTPHLAHQRAPWVMLNWADAERLGLGDGDVAVVQLPDGEHRGAVRTSRRLHPGAVRINRRGAPVAGVAQVVPAGGTR
jgi:NADH-quinone oxidoreductase subunit G